MYEGMNKGLQLSRGDYIIILNSDDWYNEDAIELLVSAAKNSDSDVVSALAIETDGFGKVIRQIPKVPMGYNVFMRMPLRHETMLISRKFYEMTGLYDPSYKIIGDLKKTQQLFLANAKFFQLQKYIMFFRIDGAASSLTGNFIAERKRLLSENFNLLESNEINLLANEYQHNSEPYSVLCKKYSQQSKLIKSILSFLKMNSVKSLRNL
jgi:glycosyltransferase involved in cell wall biosynthesis